MQLTIRGALPELEKDEQEQIDNLMRVYQSAKRYGFNRLLEKHKLNELKKDVMAKFGLNARYSYAAMKDAEGTIKSQKELIKGEVYETKEKLKRSRKKLGKVNAPLKREGICARIDKLTTKLDRYEKHLEEGTIPKVIFGGRENFMNLQKGKISKEEWKKLRSNAFYSVGGKIDGGNQNLRITHIEDNIFRLRVNISERRWIYTRLWIPSRYVDYLKQAIKGSYSVRVVKKDKYEVHISSDHQGIELDFSNGVAGFDINTDNISVTIATRDGNFRASKVFKCPELLYTRTNRRKWLLGNLVKEAFEWIKFHDVRTVAIENLKLRKTFDTNRRYNRKVSNFIHAKAIGLIKSRAVKEKIAIKGVNPRFSSFIGDYKYTSTYGLSVHQAAAFVIARRAMGYMERVPKILLMFINFVKKRDPSTKPMEGLKKWGLLYGIMKRVANSKIQNVLCTFGSSMGLDDAETVNSVLHGAIPCPTRW
ncbi:MAG: hypothetical protein L6243_05800 [Candidatus Altiarchaeales archaeon]|nr:hypothetical protein [Candidatus Altiarchaeota archaeon]MBU4341164.1 hypothetical protein [Candidatus Altiarchaeota archaeon]MBU4437147.1 hypothetical protein [Candidatus Altiarchaeota archaeon]MCG2783085.1 hypothetical protein [Candidatus Altiarchaeales archaeon]